MRRKIACSLATVLVISTTAAFGAIKEGSFSVTPLVGGYSYVDDPSDETALVLGARAGYNFTKAIGIEAVYDYVTRANDLSGSPFSLHRFGGQMLYHFCPDKALVPYVAAGLSNLNFRGDTHNVSNRGAFDYGAGAKYFLADDFAFRGDVRHLVYSYNSGTNNNVEFTLGAYFQFGAPEPVAKAVVPPPEPVKVVAPPPAPEPVKVVAAPVPVPPADSDGDGVIDSLDKCPGTPSGVAVDGNGCPLDSDKDGVADYLDKCPGTPAGVTVDSNGCPVDSDKDGVADYLDKCPETPAGAPVDAAGCPVDSDKDGVADYLDKCPDTPAGVAVDAKGCPMEAAKRFCDKPSVIAITFDANKAVVKDQFHAELDTLGKFLKDFPGSKGTIEGHTDSDGSNAANQKLSQVRAESVRNYIINKFGIDASRITAKGYGETKPVASNKTKAGKAQNRRIEAVFTCE